MKSTSGWKVTLLDNSPVREIAPLGKLDEFDHVDELTTKSDGGRGDKKGLDRWSDSQNGQEGHGGSEYGRQKIDNPRQKAVSDSKLNAMARLEQVDIDG